MKADEVYRVLLRKILALEDRIGRVGGVISGGGVGPTDAEYLVGASHSSLSAERVVTDTASVAWDLATAGQAKANAILPGRLIGVQQITATGSYTYTPTVGTTSIVIELVGGGGGGAGVLSAAALQVNLGEGGGGGGYLRKRLTANFSGATGSVGAKGTGGSAGNNSGNNGGNTTFVDTAGSPTTYTAGGGVGGAPRTSFAPPITCAGGAGGSATNGDLNQPGGAGFPGQAPNTSVGWSGGGGSSHYANFTDATVIGGAGSSTAGASAVGKGGGGSGANSTNAGGSKAGGDGADGIVIIWEYS